MARRTSFSEPSQPGLVPSSTVRATRRLSITRAQEGASPFETIGQSVWNRDHIRHTTALQALCVVPATGSAPTRIITGDR